MKRVSYIVFGIAILAFASCQKEAIMPNDPAHNASDVEWRSAEVKAVKECGTHSSSHASAITDPNAINSGGGSVATSNEGSTDDSGITDPNNDPDSAKKKVKSNSLNILKRAPQNGAFFMSEKFVNLC